MTTLSKYLAQTKTGENNVVVISGAGNSRRVVIKTKSGMVELSHIFLKTKNVITTKIAFDNADDKGVPETIKEINNIFGDNFLDIKWDKAIVDNNNPKHLPNMNRSIMLRVKNDIFVGIRYLMDDKVPKV